ncbi:hypothetical protein C5Y96_02240 [Blastopirellula marina]|uniref:Carboxypeptidase regulatory-like domain-containing protein n=1 Tax=Blastopirellula marina TaxID=124 RepID=A0A2S8G382_9BACT|nr:MULTISPECIES: carboxypeptidase regulatory-like domain-containing protein [Pirellulaceae]PQO38721.1 hypothetical protein C5Y96_02240 [Blastopirellula marina]RCS55029.1 carboxypeptidase regulatory-like domain-containing protein [Bremerella cremea]
MFTYELKRVTAVLGLSFVLLSLGCGKQEYGDLGQATGVVTLNGNPYPGAMVTFTPGKGRPSIAITNEDGSYELVYIRDTKGVVPGEHRVSISTVPPVQPDDYRGPAFKDPLPVRYNKKSELTRTVELGPNTFDFELTSK